MKNCWVATWLSVLPAAALLAADVRLEGRGVQVSLLKPPLEFAARRVFAASGAAEDVVFEDVSGRLPLSEGALTFAAASARPQEHDDRKELLLDGAVCIMVASGLPAATSAAQAGLFPGRSPDATEKPTVGRYNARITAARAVVRQDTLLVEDDIRIEAAADWGSTEITGADHVLVREGQAEVAGDFQFRISKADAVLKGAAPRLLLRRLASDKENRGLATGFAAEFVAGFEATDGTYRVAAWRGLATMVREGDEYRASGLEGADVSIEAPGMKGRADAVVGRPAAGGTAGAFEWRARGNVRLEHQGLLLSAAEARFGGAEQPLLLLPGAGERVQVTSETARGLPPTETIAGVHAKQGGGGWRLASEGPVRIARAPGASSTVREAASLIEFTEAREIAVEFADARSSITCENGRLLADNARLAFAGGRGEASVARGAHKYAARFGSISVDVSNNEIVRAELTGRDGPVSLQVQLADGAAEVRAGRLEKAGTELVAHGPDVRVISARGNVECRRLAATVSDLGVSVALDGPLRYESEADGVVFSCLNARARLAPESANRGLAGKLLPDTAEASGEVVLQGPDFIIRGEKVVKSAQNRYTMHGNPVVVERAGKTLTVTGGKVEYHGDTGRIIPEGGEIHVETR